VPTHPSVTREAQLPESVFARLAGKLAKHPGPTYPLHIGDICLPPAAVWDAAAPATPSLGQYGYPAGEPELIRALVGKLRQYNRLDHVVPESLQVTVGATHALACATRTVMGPGDECLLLAPYWPLIRGVVALTGAVPVDVAFYDRLRGADVEGLLRPHLTARTSAVYFATPNNPDGSVLGRDVLRAILKFATDHGLWVLADECYERQVFGGEHVSISSLPGASDRVLTAFSFSKSHSLAGLRLGYLAGPPPVMALARRVANHTVYNPPSGAQAVGLAALGCGESYFQDQRDRARRARDRMLSHLRVPHDVPAGGAFVFVNLRDVLGGRPLDDLLEACVERGLLLAPGVAFGSPYADWARLCFTACPEDQLETAVMILNDVVASF